MLRATTALRISEVSGLVVGDIDLAAGVLQIERLTYRGRGGLVVKRPRAGVGAYYRSSTRFDRHWSG